MQNQDAGSRTLRRGLDVLAVVIRSGNDGIRVADICRCCELERATVYRILQTLIHAGYVETSGRYRYVAGTRINQWQADVALSQSQVAHRLKTILQHVSGVTGDAAFAVVREGRMSSCIARAVGSHPVQILAVDVGMRQPLGVGAAGLALLAALPGEEADAIIAQHGDTLADYGNLSPNELHTLVRATRERGWSVIGNHAARGALGVGVAVCEEGGGPTAAISVAAPLERMSRQRQELIVNSIRAALDTGEKMRASM
ncbi:IclR family transcriptional regulator [Trinickia sp.]|uniref:IclR family transcriptional regulator n=1 Tax=Trinickia sp. TaxID=2571163 RepID=UPI003F7F8D7B